MNLRDQLKEILPDILPRNPAQAIKGTELIEMVKHRLKQEYSDATLRYHFSIMSCDPSAPIAKVEQGQGYYLRSSTIHSMNSVRNFFRADGGESSGGGAMTPAEIDLALARAGKFRAVVTRYLESVGQIPFLFEQSFSCDAASNRWRVPDLAAVDWLAAAPSEDGPVIDRDKAEVLRRLGRPPLRVSAAKLRLDLDPGSLREDLHECLAASEWADSGELIVAAPVEDPGMADEIRRFASRYGIGVISFGLDAAMIDDMPEAAVIENFDSSSFSPVASLIRIRRHAAPFSVRDFDWSHVAAAAETYPDFERFQGWISRCLLEERIITARDYEDLERDAASTREFVA